ncbi:MAG: PilZ domain-containing protein [Candidatus Omnitrophica bacterium]|nr:PilZ domain-containing protein [Candidatus Omnitrophota bacterium]
MEYAGQEKRRHPRINARFIVSYRILDKEDKVDITQTKNLSLGGMLITTNRKFEPGTNLLMEIRLPFDPQPTVIYGRVVESREIAKNLIYDTHICFGHMEGRKTKVVIDTVDYYIHKKGKDSL